MARSEGNLGLRVGRSFVGWVVVGKSVGFVRVGECFEVGMVEEIL